jgi:predicted MarR family transcription regulator
MNDLGDVSVFYRGKLVSCYQMAEEKLVGVVEVLYGVVCVFSLWRLWCFSAAGETSSKSKQMLDK